MERLAQLPPLSDSGHRNPFILRRHSGSFHQLNTHLPQGMTSTLSGLENMKRYLDPFLFPSIRNNNNLRRVLNECTKQLPFKRSQRITKNKTQHKRIYTGSHGSTLVGIIWWGTFLLIMPHYILHLKHDVDLYLVPVQTEWNIFKWHRYCTSTLRIFGASS